MSEAKVRDRISLQEYADKIVDPRYRQELKTAQAVVDANEWGSPDEPMCCDEKVLVQSMLGMAYHAECAKCGKFARSLDGPMFSESGSSVSFMDGDKVDFDTDVTWIVGLRESPSPRKATGDSE